jgi:hypothetical protein
VLIDDNPGNADAARQSRELARREFTDYFAVSRIDLLNDLIVGIRSNAKLVGLARIVEILVEQLNLRAKVRSGRPGRGSAARRQNIAAVLNCFYRRLTSMHEARRRYLYRLSVTSHGFTYLLNAYLCVSFRAPFEDHGPTAFGRAVGFSSLLLSYRPLGQKLENQLRLLVRLGQNRDTGLFQHLRLGQIRGFRRKVRILNGAARLGQVLCS